MRMELKHFVEETLKQIVEGVSLAQESISTYGASINPSGIRYTKDGNFNQYDHVMPQEVTFNVGLTSSKKSDSSEGIGVFLGSVNLGKKNDSGSEDVAVSSVKFTIPLALPEGENFKNKNRKKTGDML